MYEFNTEVNINLLENGNELPGSGKAMVKWVMTLEARDYGVKCFGLYVPEQKVKVDITCYDSETNEKFVVEKELDLKDVKIEELESAGNFRHLHLYPTELEVCNDNFELRF